MAKWRWDFRNYSEWTPFGLDVRERDLYKQEMAERESERIRREQMRADKTVRVRSIDEILDGIGRGARGNATNIDTSKRIRNWKHPGDYVMDAPVHIPSPKQKGVYHGPGTGIMRLRDSLRGDDSHLFHYDKLRLYSMLSSESEKFRDIESYEEVEHMAWTEEELERQIRAEIEKQRGNIEQRVGRKLSTQEWNTIKERLHGEASAQYRKQHPLPKSIKNQSKKARINRMIEAYKADKVVKSGYVMGPDGPRRAFGLTKKDSKWKNTFDIEGKDPRRYLLTTAGGERMEELSKQIHYYNEDNEVLRAMRQDVMKAKQGEQINFENTLKAMQAGRHRGMIKDYGIAETGTYGQYQAFHMFKDFLERRMSVRHELPEYIMHNERTYMFDLSAYLERARDSVSSVYYGGNNNAYQEVEHKPHMTQEERNAIRKLRRKEMTPYGLAMEEMEYLQKLQDHTRDSYEMIRDERRENGPGADEGTSNTPAHGDQFRSDFDRDQDQRMKGNQISRDPEEYERHLKQIESDWEMDKLKEELRNPDGTYRNRPMTPHEALRREAQRQVAVQNPDKKVPIQGPRPDPVTKWRMLTELHYEDKLDVWEPKENWLAWERQIIDNPEHLIQLPNDLSIHQPLGAPDARGQIPTLRKHVIAKEANFQLELKADNDVKDTKGKLMQAAHDLDEARLKTDVEKLIERPEKFSFKLGTDLGKDLNLHGELQAAESIIKASKDGSVVLHRENLRNALINGLWVNKRDGSAKLPKWAHGTLVDRAHWLFGSHDGSLGSYFFEAVEAVLNNPKYTSLNFEELRKDKQYLSRLDRLGHVENPLVRHFMAASNRDIVNEMMKSFFQDVGDGGQRGLNHNLQEIIRLYQEDVGRRGVAPTLAEIEDLVRETNEALKKDGFDHLESTLKYIRENWRAVQEQFTEKPPISRNSYENPDGIDRHYTDELPSEADEVVREIDEDWASQQAARQAEAKESKEVRKMRQALERQLGGRGHSDTAELLVKLRNTLPEFEEDGVTPNQKRSYKNIAHFYADTLKAQEEAQLNAGRRITVLADMVDGNGSLTLSSAEHGRQFAGFLKYGFKIHGSAEIDGERRYGHLELGRDGQLFFRDNRDMPILVVDDRSQALSEISANRDFDERYIRKAAIEDYRGIQAPEGHVPIVLNEGNIREASRLGKGNNIPQTMAETLMNMEEVRNGARLVTMDMETTLLPAGTEEMQHMLEMSLRASKWDAEKQKLIPKGNLRMLLKPDDAMRAQVNSVINSLDHSRIQEIAQMVSRFSTEAEKLKALNGVEEISYLRNIAKYAATKSAKISADFKTMPADIMENLTRLKRDAGTAMKWLDRHGTHSLEEMMKATTDFIGDGVVLAQNGGNAEARWMETFQRRLGTEARLTEESIQKVLDQGFHEVEQMGFKPDTIMGAIDIWSNNKLAGKQAMDFMMKVHAGTEQEVPLRENLKTLARAYALEDLRVFHDTGKTEEAFGALREMRSRFGDWLDIEEKDLPGIFQDMKHVPKFNPPMIELMHASRNFNDAPGMRHNMEEQVARAAENDRLGAKLAEEYKNKAHFANVDTKVTEQVFGNYMRAFDQDGGFRPEFLPEGATVAKVNSTGDTLPHGVYTVGKWDEAAKQLQLFDHAGREVFMPAAGQAELGALFQSNFLLAPEGIDPHDFARRMSDTMAFDSARRDVQDANSYTRFMNNRIKNLAAMNGNVDERGYTPNPAVVGYKTQGGVTEAPERISVTENQRLAAPHGAEYWSSAEADLKQQAYGRLKDLSDLNQINEKQAQEILGRVDAAFKEIGGDRPKRELYGMLDAGELGDRYENRRLLLGARSENELYHDLWQSANDLKQYIPNQGLTEDQRRNKAIREILIPHLSSERGGNLLPVMAPTAGDTLAPDERINSIAKRIYEGHIKGKSLPIANVDDIKPVITGDNRAQAENVMNAIFQEEVDKMSPAAQRAYAAAQAQRLQMEQEFGGMLPEDIRLARIAADEATTLDVGQRWNGAMKGKGITEIMDIAGRGRTPEEKDLQRIALRELNSMANRLKSNPRDEEGLTARTFLGRDPGADLAESIMPVGPYSGQKMSELPDDYIRSTLASSEPRYADHQDLIRGYLDQLRQEDRVYENPRNKQEMERMLETGAKPAPVETQPADLLQYPARNAVGEEATRVTIEDTASSLAFKQATEQYSANPKEFVEPGRASRMAEAGLDTVGQSMKKASLKGLGIAGLGIAGAFLLGNMLTDPSTWKRPNGDSPNPDGDYLDQPQADMGQPVARVEDHGSGLDGMRVRVKGRAPGHMSNEQIGAMVGDGIKGGVSHETNVRVNSRDDTSRINGDWLKQTYTEFMRNGYVNG